MALDFTDVTDITDIKSKIEAGIPLGTRIETKSGEIKYRDLGTFRMCRIFSVPENTEAWLKKTMRPDDRLTCPSCGGGKILFTNVPKYPYRSGIGKCRTRFSVTNGTLMHGSKLPLWNWIFAVHQEMSNSKGVSSMEMSRDLEINQSTAWFLQQCVREVFMHVPPPAEFMLGGTVQIDATSIGGACHDQDGIARTSGTGLRLSPKRPGKFRYSDRRVMALNIRRRIRIIWDRRRRG